MTFQDANHSPLFGSDPTERIVSAEPAYGGGLTLFIREGDKIAKEIRACPRWILTDRRPNFEINGANVVELEGDEGYRFLLEFEKQAEYQNARHSFRESHAANLTYAAGAKGMLMHCGLQLFKGMAFDDIVRLQFDLETAGLDPNVPENRILLIAVSDNRGFLEMVEGDEKQILDRFAEIIRQRDPDVLEGHNLLGFDFPYVISRAQRNGIRLFIGRDGSEPRIGEERNYAVTAGNSRPFRPVYLFGRHVLDTYLMVQRFDWAKGALTSFGLKEVARTFGFAAEDRVELPRDRMEELYKSDPELVLKYAMQDVIETRQLADLITPSDFYQTQMVPDNYAAVAITGNGEKINSIFIRACLRAGKAVPQASSSCPYPGGYTEVRIRGVVERVVKADVESLYPSLMLTYQIAPASDKANIFLPCLRELTTRRIDAKRKLRTDPENSHYWDGLQNSYKTLINSFYGYLGGPFNFNDYDAAGKITEAGREVAQRIAEETEKLGGKVIEIDTDGIYFSPPPEIAETEEAETEFVEKAGAFLPEGIRLAFDGRYQAMLSIKTKNYVLENYGGKKIFKGSALRSRADEWFGRKFLTFAVDRLFERDVEAIGARYAELLQELLDHKVPIEDMARRERITENTFQSEGRSRMAKAIQGGKVGDFVKLYERSDGSLAPIADYSQDENVKTYMGKLYKFAKRLEEAFEAISPGSFARLIPKPNAQGIPHSAQTTLDLFG